MEVLFVQSYQLGYQWNWFVKSNYFREIQLKIFMHYMPPILKRQELDFAIYVVNQVDDKK